MSSGKLQLVHPTEQHIAWRKRFSAMWRPFYAPARVQIVDNAVSKADELLEQGWGLVCPFTHFCGRDVVEMVQRSFLAGQTLVTRPIVVGVEWSFMQGLSPLRFFAGMTGITLVPIVTEDSIKKDKNYDHDKRPLPLGHGTMDYLSVALRALKEGGAVFVSPQQGRRPRLELSDKEPMRFLLGKENDSQNVAVLFVALSLLGEVDYSKRTFLNLGRTFDVRLGPVMTKAELFKLSRAMGKSIDDTTIIVFSQLVDPGYNDVDPELTKSYLLNRQTLLNNVTGVSPD